MNKRLKVAVFHFGFFYSGGGEKLVLEEAMSFRKAGWKVDLFAPIVEKDKCFPDLIDKVNVAPIMPMLPSWFPRRDTIQVFMTCIFFPIFMPRYRHYDVVLGTNQPGIYFGFLLNKVYKIPYVAYVAQPLRLLHPRKVDEETGLYLRYRMKFTPFILKYFRDAIDFLDRQSLKNAGKILANGENSAEKIFRTYGIRASLCPAGAYPIKKVVPFSKRLKNPYILLTNRHFPQKRFEYAISALSLITKRHPDIKLVITGEKTTYTQFLEELVIQLSLRDMVVFKGFVSEKECRKLYENALVYVYTAPEEDFGMGVIEAMACGTPVVAWNNGGPKFILNGELKRYLARPFSVSDFAQKIINIIDGKSYRKISGQCWKLVKDKYCYSSHNGLIYEDLLSVSNKISRSGNDRQNAIDR